MGLHRSQITALLMGLTMAACGQPPGGVVGGAGDPCPGKRWGLADARGKLVVDYQFADLRSSENEALVAKDTRGRYGILAPDGHALSAFEYESAIPYFGGMI